MIDRLRLRVRQEIDATSNVTWGFIGFGLFIALASVVQGLLGVSK
jgi:hypothetical protein